MEPFTLIIWLWMGARYEETRILDLGRAECFERAHAIERSRYKAFQQKETGQAEAKAECTAPGYKKPDDDRSIQCAACGRLPEWPRLPPGHKRI